MEITRKTDYALRMLADLVRTPESMVSVREAAEKTGVPYSFARGIQHDLVVAGILSATRGAHGGVRLACDPEKTTLLEVVEAMQGPVAFNVCECGCAEQEDHSCGRTELCPYRRIWKRSRELMEAYLGSITLSDAIRLGDAQVARDLEEGLEIPAFEFDSDAAGL
jgi:Rrf2 family protein